jgi:hypothetical protein
MTRSRGAGTWIRRGRPRPARSRPWKAVDLNDGHPAVAVVAPDGNVTGAPFTIALQLSGLPAPARDGRLRAAVTTLTATAKAAEPARSSSRT